MVKRKKNYKPYNIEAPSTEVSHTVNSAPQVAVLTSETAHWTGDDSISATIQRSDDLNLLFYTRMETDPRQKKLIDS